MVFYFFTSSKPSCLVTAAITAALLALPSNGVTWLPVCARTRYDGYAFPYSGTVSHPFFPSAHRGQRRYHVKNCCHRKLILLREAFGKDGGLWVVIVTMWRRVAGLALSNVPSTRPQTPDKKQSGPLPKTRILDRTAVESQTSHRNNSCFDKACCIKMQWPIYFYQSDGLCLTGRVTHSTFNYTLRTLPPFSHRMSGAGVACTQHSSVTASPSQQRRSFSSRLITGSVCTFL
jgi:hypothetical protein